VLSPRRNTSSAFSAASISTGAAIVRVRSSSSRTFSHTATSSFSRRSRAARRNRSRSVSRFAAYGAIVVAAQNGAAGADARRSLSCGVLR
jgi:hypothetical protein